MFYDLGLHQSCVMSRTKLMKIGPTRRCINSRRGGRKTRQKTVKPVRPLKNRKVNCRRITPERLNPAKMPHIAKEEFKTYNHGLIAYPDLYYELANYHALVVQSKQCVTTAILLRRARELAECLGIDLKKIEHSWLHYFLKCCATLREKIQHKNGISNYFKSVKKCTPEETKSPVVESPKVPNNCEAASPVEKEGCPGNESTLFSLFAQNPVETTKSTEPVETSDLTDLFSVFSPSECTVVKSNNVCDTNNIENDQPASHARKSNLNTKNTTREPSEELVCGIYLKFRKAKQLKKKRTYGKPVPDALRQKRCLYYYDPVFEFPELLPRSLKEVRVKTPSPVPPSEVNEDVYSDLFNAVQSSFSL